MSSSAPPSHKLIPGCGFLVDGFRHAGSRAAKAFFLSHAHSDHYTGLKGDWDRGPIYCSDITARLVAHMLGVRPQYLHPLPLDTPTMIQGVEVTLVDANHCPGAVQFLFLLPDGRKYIHTGDMRFAPALLNNPNLQRFRGCDAVFLDTTYCNPRYCFPAQEESIEYVATTVQRLLQEDAAQRDAGQQQQQQQQQDTQQQDTQQQDAQQLEGGGGRQQDERQQQRAAAAAPAAGGGGEGQERDAAPAASKGRPSFRRLYLIATYGIGKERLLTAVHDRCGVQLHVADRKHAVMQQLDLPGYDPAQLFTTDRSATPVHVVQWGFLGETWPYFRPNFTNMEAYRQQHGADEVVGIVPTGWLYEMKKTKFAVRSKGACSVHLVPYSEHSSFAELQDYGRFLRPHQVVPTVGVDGEDADKARQKMQSHFRLLVDGTASKAKFLAGFRRNSGGSGAEAGSGPAGVQQEEETGEEGQQEEQQEGQQEDRHNAELGEPDAASGRGGERGGREDLSEQQGSEGRLEVVDLAVEESSEDDGEDDEGAEADEVRRRGGRGPAAVASGTGAAAALDSPGAAAAAAWGRRDSPSAASSLGQGQAAGASAAAAAAADAAPAAPAAAAAAAAAVPAAAAAAGEGGASGSEPELSQLLAVLGEGVSQQRGRQLLAAARGDVQAAINGYLDGQAGGSGRGGQAGGSGAAAGTTGVGGGGGAGGGAAASRRGGTSTASASSPAVAGRGSSKTGAKRPPGGAAGGKGWGKRQKGAAGAAASPGQRSIASFFAKQSPPAVAQQQQPQEKQQQQQQQQQPHEETASHAVLAAAAAVEGTGEDCMEEGEEEELAVTPNAPLAATRAQRAAAASAAIGAAEAAAAQQAAGPKAKAKITLPPPPPPGSSSCLQQKAGGVSGSGAGSASGGRAESRKGRDSEVPRDAVTLPIGNYDPVAHACWRAGEPTPYLHIARAFEAMDSTTKRLRISDVLVNCFRSVLVLGPPGELVTAAYLLSGRIAPDYEPGAELNVGGSTVVAAITEATGVSRARLSEMYKELGDLGDVASACKRTQSLLQLPAPLTVPGVFATLQQISREKGQGAAGRRQRLVLSLLRACRESETKFIVRTLIQALRVGANWRSVIPALGKAIVLHKEGARVPKARLDAAGAAATAAFHVCPNLQLLLDALLGSPLEEWQQRCSLTPGIPIKPMLAKICEGLPDAIRQLKGAPFLAEFKYDGMRAQIHMTSDRQVRIFSRNCEEKTEEFPDVVQQTLAAAAGGATAAILDAELVAVQHGADGVRLRAFQELSTRKRADVTAGNISVPVGIFAFDLLYRDGASLAHLPLRERRRQLVRAFPSMQPGHFALAESWEFPGSAGEAAGETEAGVAEGVAEEEAGALFGTAAGAVEAGTAGGAEGDAEGSGEGASSAAGSGDAARKLPAASAAPAAPLEDRLQECLLEAFAAGTEGLMLKSLAGPYEPSRRSDHWIKLKRDYCEGLHDTLDLVVIGAWWGNGRKKGWYSPYLLACFDPETEELQSVCRCMSGFSDQFYKDSLERLQQTVIPGPKPYYRTDERPNVWFDPREVWEIRGADLTISPVHKAAVGRVHEGRGIGLRFPRFLRIREDKRPEDATSAEQIAGMFHAQTRKVETAGLRLVERRERDRPQQRQRLEQQRAADAVGPPLAAAGPPGGGEEYGSGSEGGEDAEEEVEEGASRRRRTALDLGL